MVYPFNTSVPCVISGYFLCWRIADDPGNSLAACYYFNSDIVFILCLCPLAILIANLQDMVYDAEFIEYFMGYLVRQICLKLA